MRKIEENLYEFGLYNDFLNITPKHKQQKKKWINSTSSKVRTFVLQKTLSRK